MERAWLELGEQRQTKHGGNPEATLRQAKDGYCIPVKERAVKVERVEGRQEGW